VRRAIIYGPGLCFALLLLAGCAKVINPTGGDKDETPPKILVSTPANFSTNFTDNKIRLEFDEFVITKGLSSQLIVSPPLKEMPEVKVKGKAIEISWNDTLLEQTTYTFNFGDGIVDNNEGNPLDSNLFVFSTGIFLDSMDWKGSVKNAFTLVPEPGLLVMLYKNLEDSVASKERPTYFSKTKEDGSFELSYMATGTYQAFVLKDNNANYLFDLPSEGMAFLDDVVVLPNKDSLPTALIYFEEDVEKQYLKKSLAPSFGKLQFVFNRAVGESGIERLNGILTEDDYLTEWNVGRDSVTYWLTNPQAGDSLELQIVADTTIDTVSLVVPSKDSKQAKRGSKSNRKGGGIKLVVQSPAKRGGADFFRPLGFYLSHPYQSHDFSKIFFTTKKDTVIDTLTIDSAQISTGFRDVQVDYTWEQGRQYKMLITPDAFVDIFGLTTDTMQLSFTASSVEDYGILDLDIVLDQPDHQLLVQLLDPNGKIVQEDTMKQVGTMHYENLRPMQYGVKIVFDANNNGKWDTGNYGAKKQPEKVVFYAGQIEIRSNWDLELEWIIEPTPKKE